eukprot:921240-Karenia_brevis.AAC.1
MEGAEVDTGIQAETCSVEVDKSQKAWHVGAVERIPHHSRVQINEWERFRDDDEDEDEGDYIDCPAL